MLLRIGIIGCGTIAQKRHAPEYAMHPGCMLCGYYDAVPQKAQELAALYGGTVYDSAQSLLEDPQIDAVSICAVNRLHTALSIEALKNNKHVLCEKPIASKLSDAQTLCDAAERSDKLCMIAHNQRLSPAHIEAKALLQSGVLGRVLSFSTFFCHGGPEAWVNQPDNGPLWFFENRDELGGILTDLGIHKVDLLRWLLEDEVLQVSALGGTLDKKTRDGTPIDTYDNAAVLLRFRKGAIGTMLTSWTAYGKEDNSTTLHCSEGILKIYHDDAYQLEMIGKDGKSQQKQIGAMATNEKQNHSGVIDLFVNSILQKKRSPISAAEGCASLAVIAAAVDSMRLSETTTVML